MEKLVSENLLQCWLLERGVMSELHHHHDDHLVSPLPPTFAKVFSQFPAFGRLFFTVFIVSSHRLHLFHQDDDNDGRWMDGYDELSLDQVYCQVCCLVFGVPVVIPEEVSSSSSLARSIPYCCVIISWISFMSTLMASMSLTTSSAIYR